MKLQLSRGSHLHVPQSVVHLIGVPQVPEIVTVLYFEKDDK